MNKNFNYKLYFMKLLLIHSDFIEFEPKEKAIKQAEPISKEKTRIEECLVVFTAVEEGDDESVVKNAEKEIREVIKNINANKVVIYPFVHLSNKPASPSHALTLLNLLQKQLNAERAPFGWYKAFAIKCKGHALAELSKEISKETIPKALEKEKELISYWYIFTPDGKKHEIKIHDNKIIGFDFSNYENLKKLAQYEMKKSRIVTTEPPHIKLMQKLGIANYEQASDPGQFRFLPKGRLIKSLIEEFVTLKTIEYGAVEVETPFMYDFEHPALKNYLNRFPARQYTITTPNKKVFTRFSACFGQFLIASDATISYKHLPLRIYELAKSFRVEQRGELAGLKRLRCFTMPDVHAFCKDFEQAKKEMIKRFELANTILNKIGISKNYIEFSLRVVKNFYEENKDFIHEIVKKWNKPVLVEMWDEKFFYFVVKCEWNFIDALEKAACLSTDQIDVENAKRFHITYIDENNNEKYPLILHMSPSGSIERVIYALIEQAFMEHEKRHINPTLPLWLAPTQIRLCTVSEEYNEYAEKLSKKLESRDIRVDIDDRNESIPRKIRDAEIEWINLIVVIGEKEKNTGKLSVRIRETGEIKEMGIEELISIVKEQTNGMPFKPLNLPKLLSKRPVFI